jgi:hypothetical protein
LQEDIYDNLTEPSEEEEDMLDQAFGLTSTSRLGCQIFLNKSFDGMVVQLPSATRNFYVVRFVLFRKRFLSHPLRTRMDIYQSRTK